MEFAEEGLAITLNDIRDSLGSLHHAVDQRQLDAGYPDVFHVGDLVRFPLGTMWTRERDYRITDRGPNGVAVQLVSDHLWPSEVMLDEAVLRLGMRHSPNHKKPVPEIPEQSTND